MKLSDFKEDRNLEKSDKLILNYTIEDTADNPYKFRKDDKSQLIMWIYKLFDARKALGEINEVAGKYDLVNKNVINFIVFVNEGEASKAILRNAILEDTPES